MAGKTTKKSPFDCAAFYTITSKLSGKAVTACGESEVRMFASTEEDRQQWKLVAADAGAYRLISKTTGKALDIMLAGENDGAQLHQWKEDIRPYAELGAGADTGWQLQNQIRCIRQMHGYC